MNRTRYPCRQLNSQAIKSAALCYVSPIIAGKCSIVRAQCVCQVHEAGIQRAWKNIFKTRDTCDKAICSKKQLTWLILVCFYKKREFA